MKSKITFLLFLILFSLISQIPFLAEENQTTDTQSESNNNLINDVSTKSVSQATRSAKLDYSIAKTNSEVLSNENSVTTIDPTKIYQGESYRVDYTYKKNRVIQEISTGGSSAVTITNELSDTYINDGVNYLLETTSSGGYSYAFADQTAPVGTLYSRTEVYTILDFPAKFLSDFNYDIALTSGATYAINALSSTSISSNYISYDERVTIAIVGQLTLTNVFATSDFYMAASIFAIDQDTQTWVFLKSHTRSDLASVSGDSSLDLDIDYLDIQHQVVTQNLRVNYHYTSESVIIKELDIEIYEYGVDVDVYTNDDMISISPVVSYASTAGIWEFQTTVATTYYLKFSSSSSQFLALEDVTDYYIQGDFEGEHSIINDATTYSYDTIELSTSVVFSGAYSLYFEDATSGDRDISYIDLLDDGVYGDQIEIIDTSFYLSFSYYTSSASYASLYYRHYSDNSWEYIDFDTLNRWTTVFVYMQDIDEMRFDTRSNKAVNFYIDNFKIWRPSGSVETVGLNEYEFSASFISWDGYQNPALTNKEVQWSLRDRTADTEIISKSLTTDNQGIASYLYQVSLEQKEYENRWWSDDSFFSDFATNELGDSWDFEDTEDMVTVQASITAADGILTYVDTSSSSSYLKLITNFNLDTSKYQYLMNRMYSTVSTYSTYHRIYDGAAYNIVTPTYDIATTWTITRYDLTDDVDWTGTALNLFLIDDALSADQGTVYLDWFKIVGAGFYQNSYFTPIPSSDIPYSYETKQDKSKNYWDFSEGTEEDFVFIGNSGAEVFEVQSGYLWIEEDQAGGNPRTQNSKAIDTDFYDKIKMRIYSNISSNIYLRTYALSVLSSTFTLNVGWNILDITPNSLWTGDYTSGLAFRINTANTQILLDFMIPYHSSSSDLYETDNSFILSSINDTRSYYVEIDNAWNYFNDLEYIPKNLTIGDHSLNIAQIYDTSIDLDLVQIPDDFSNSTYTVLDELIVSVLDFSLSDQYVQTYIISSKDYSYTIYENDTSIATGSGISSGTSIQSSRNTSPGYLVNYAIKFVNSTDTIWFNSSYSNAAAITPANLTIYLTEFDYDIAGEYIYFNWLTSWENTTAYIYDNSSLLGSGPETSLVVSFTANTGWHNITILVKNGVTTKYTLFTSFTMSTTSYEIDIDIFDGVGLGIPFDTVKVYANISGTLLRIPESFYWFNTSINIVVKDYFDVVLVTTTYSMTSNVVNYLNLQISIFSLSILNPYDVDVNFIVRRNGHETNYVIPTNSSLILRLTIGPYVFVMSEYYEKKYGEIEDPYQPEYAATQTNFDHSQVANYRVYLKQRDAPEQAPKWNLSQIQIVLFLLSIVGGMLTIRTVKREVEKKGWKGFMASFFN